MAESDSGFLLAGMLAVSGSGCRGNAEDDNFTMMRKNMVREQIEARGVKDPAVLAAMEKVQRHLFMDEKYAALAYADHPLPIEEGQTISQPYIVALMTELLAPSKNDRVLEIGTGSGYQAAVLAEIVSEVFSVEIIPSLAESAEKLLDELGYKNISVKAGDGFLGWEEHAPYDGIIVTCAPKDIPAPLIEQLKEGGRLVIPVGEGFQNLKLGEKKNGKFIVRNIIPVRFVPMTGIATGETKTPADSFRLEKELEKWRKIFGKKIDTGIAVSVPEQKLYFIEKGKVRKIFPVSTSKYGTGSEAGSNKTPLGTHIIRQKVGGGAEEGIIFQSLINTRRKARIHKDTVDVPEDFVTTRVMALAGMEKGLNKGGNKDSFSRRIYIHGTPEEGLIGRPASHGCVRMKNSDVIELFDLVSEGMPVEILE
ncbi:MAG: hypothetical protein COZ72_05165 [Elusimicrobia bacterium CG_4_8_14_3_um_filter_50_9]|nr:MAG: hypothetical protein COZ72_05165 [Elusimicrobia bacterium CG_4_8_14_3_um_filter_50_9]